MVICCRLQVQWLMLLVRLTVLRLLELSLSESRQVLLLEVLTVRQVLQAFRLI